MIDWDRPIRLRSHLKTPVKVLARDLPGEYRYAIAAMEPARVSHLLLVNEMGLSLFGIMPEIENVPPDPVKLYVYGVKYSLDSGWHYTTTKHVIKEGSFAACRLIQELTVVE